MGGGTLFVTGCTIKCHWEMGMSALSDLEVCKL